MNDFACPRCQTAAAGTDFERQLRICGKCRYHSRIGLQDRLRRKFFGA